MNYHGGWVDFFSHISRRRCHQILDGAGGGLHTRGKPITLKAGISRSSQQPFNPRPGELAEVVAGLESEELEGLPAYRPKTAGPDLNRPTVLLVTEEDCRPEDFDLGSLNFVGCATLATSHLRSPRPVGQLIEEFEQGALRDTALRTGLKTTELRAGVPSDLARWVSQAGATQIATPYIPTGPTRDWILDAKRDLDDAGINLVEWRRDWDSAICPMLLLGSSR